MLPRVLASRTAPKGVRNAILPAGGHRGCSLLLMLRRLDATGMRYISLLPSLPFNASILAHAEFASCCLRCEERLCRLYRIVGICHRDYIVTTGFAAL